MNKKLIRRLSRILSGLVCFGMLGVICVRGQDSDCVNNLEVNTLLEAGAKRLTNCGTNFNLKGAQIALYYDSGLLATIHVNLPEGSSIANYDYFLKLINRIKSLGSLEHIANLGVISPSGYVTRQIDFSDAYILRTEITCPIAENNVLSKSSADACGVSRFTVYYWLPLSGEVKKKKVEVVEIDGFVNLARYYITINDLELEVSKTDYQKLYEGQFVRLKRTLGIRLVQILGTCD